MPPRLYGGIERIIDMLARGLVARGHDVTLFAHPDSRSAGCLVPWPGISSGSRRDTVRNAATLTQHVLRERYDIVHSFSRLAYLAPILPGRIPKLMSYQRAISSRTTSLAHRLAHGSLQFTAISRWMVSEKPLSGRWHVVPNGVPLDVFDFQSDPGPDAPLMFLGRIEEIKGPHLAIEIARRAQLPLVIAGNIPAEHGNFFREKIEPHIDGSLVRYVGPVTDAEKNTLLGRARALLMPILWDEPFGIVMAEAMACGTPVIGFRRGAVPEVVEHGVTGFVADSIDDAVERVRRLDDIDRAHCRTRVEHQFSDQAVVDSYVDIYTEMLPAVSGRRSVTTGYPSTVSQRVCILTPGHLATNPRLVKEADALAGAGYEVSVIAADYLSWGREADRSFEDRPWQVVDRPSFGPLAPYSSQALQGVRRRLAYALWRAGVRHDAITRAAWHPICPDLVQAALKVQADIYIAHYPAALPAAAIAAGHHRALYAYDAEDFHLGDCPDDPKYEAERLLVRAIESRYLPDCAYVTAASPGIADAYAEAYGITRPEPVLNVFPRSEAPSTPSTQGTATPGPSVYWFSQTIGPDRGLECAVRAIGLARTKPHLYLRGMLAAGFLDRLKTIAAEMGSTERLHILPPAAPSEMVRLASIYDVGLAIEAGHTQNRRIALANKQFTYLIAGVPVVMSDMPAHRDIAPSLGKAARIYSADDADELAACLDELLGNPISLAVAREVAWRLGQERFNWDIEQDKLVNLIAAAFEAQHGNASDMFCST